jgi:hypothetical protein
MKSTRVETDRRVSMTTGSNKKLSLTEMEQALKLRARDVHGKETGEAPGVDQADFLGRSTIHFLDKDGNPVATLPFTHVVIAWE